MTNTYADILDQMDKRKIKKSKKGLEEWELYEQKLTASNLAINIKIPDVCLNVRIWHALGLVF